VAAQEYPGWFWLHAPLGVAAFVGGLLGVVWGAYLPSDEFEGSSLYKAHKASPELLLVCAPAAASHPSGRWM
jgi:hypothetical protein